MSEEDSVIVHVHPLVALNISEHWTKARLKDKENAQVWGVLLGKKESRGQEYEATNSFDLKITKCEYKDGKSLLTNNNFDERLKHYQEVFPELEYLGWYTTVPSEDANDVIGLQRESILLQLTPFLRLPANKLPISAFKVSSNGCLQTVDWVLTSESSERIGVEHVTKLSKLGNAKGISSVSRHLRSEASVIDMMKGRMQTIIKWLEAVQAGSLPYDDTIAREAEKVSVMAQQIKPLEQKFEKHFHTHSKDVYVAMLLSKMTNLIGTDYQTSIDSLRLRDQQTIGPMDLVEGDDTFLRPIMVPKRGPNKNDMWAI